MYLKIIDNKQFGFSDEMEENNVEISFDDYDKFFNLQSQGKQFRLKENSNGVGLFDYIEEYIAEPIVVPETETDVLKEQILNLQQMISDMQYEKLTGGV